MNIVIISGSRNPNGRTAGAIAAAQSGVEKRNAKTSVNFLPTLSIERCRQCDVDGWGMCRREGRCIIEDDFSDLVDQLNNAEGVIFATPVYFSDLSESMRAFLDRLRRISMHDSSTAEIKNKPMLGIAVAGGGGGGAPACLLQLEKIVSRCGFDVKDLIPVRRQNAGVKETVLASAGEWFADECGGR